MFIAGFVTVQKRFRGVRLYIGHAQVEGTPEVEETLRGSHDKWATAACSAGRKVSPVRYVHFIRDLTVEED